MAEMWSVYGGQVWRAMLAASAGRRDLADDVTQEAFARLITYQDTVRDPLAWLFRTAYRLLSAELKRERLTGDEVPERGVIAPQLAPDLITALSALEPKVRLCVFLHYYADMPVDAVARALGVAPGTIKRDLFDARAKLHALLEEQP